MFGVNVSITIVEDDPGPEFRDIGNINVPGTHTKWLRILIDTPIIDLKLKADIV